MKTFGFAAVCVLACLVGVAQADVQPGNLITNGDFAADLSGWTLYNTVTGGALPAWTNTVADGGGVIYTGAAAMNLYQGCNSSTGSSSDPLVLTFDVGSPDGSVTDGIFEARVFRSGGGSWPALMATESTTITASQLNAGVQSYTIHFPSTSIVLGDQYEVDLETYGVNSSSIIVLDNVAVVHASTVPEPSTLVLLGATLVSLLCYAWRKRK
jgi:hypothetical protein